MEREYQVIALDMDGTALNSQKEITPHLKQTIHDAMAAGKEVVFCTGRSYAEMKDFLDDYPEMNYLCGESGALLYNIKEKRAEMTCCIPPEIIARIREEIRGTDIMPQIMSDGETMLNYSQYHRIADYLMGDFQESYNRVVTPAEDVLELAVQGIRGVEKMNLHHTSPEERARTLEKLQKLNLPIPMVYSEIASLECSPEGVNKASGLRALCDILGITMEEVIMVGDADNDLAALEAAGLAVAMGNANEHVRAVSHVQVADNDHEGCAEAIERFLLKKY